MKDRSVRAGVQWSTWTLGWKAKGGGVLGAGVWWGIVVLQALDPSSQLADFAVLGAFATVISVAMWAAFFRPRVSLVGDQLVIKNPLSSRTIDLKQVRSLSPGYSGLLIECEGGAKFTAWVLGKDNISLLLARETRADRAALLIAEACRELSADVKVVRHVKA